jgi:hypothetical protein
MAKKARLGNARWTVMVLMGADNLVTETDLTQSAKDDIAEMARVGADPSVLQIVAHVDRKQESGGPVRLHFNGATKRGTSAPEEFAIPPGEGTSGPDVLENFLVWAKGKCPADHYLLVLWGHAYRLAFNRDPETPDGLDFPDLKAVLQRTNDGKKIDIVAFDSCNVSLIEAAYELREVADYLVASQFIDPLPGWPYDIILEKVRDSHDHFAGANGEGPKDFGRAIVSQFARHYDRQKSVTMTMLDLSCVAEIGDRIGELQTELTLAVNEDRTELAGVIEIFQRSQVPIRQPSVDLVTFCWYLLFFSRNERVRIAAATLGELLLRPKNPFVLAHARTDLLVGMLQGVSILAPNVTSGFDLASLRAAYERLDLSEHWGDLVFALAESSF